MSASLPRGITRRCWIAGTALSVSAADTGLRLPRRVRVGLAGLVGHVNEILAHLPRLPDVDLVAVSDQDPAALQRFRQREAVGGATQYADYRRMLDNEQLDMVGVCNPNGERAEAILACAERGLHVVAEKPLALRRDDLRRVREAVLRRQVRLTTLLPMRFSSPYLAIKEIVDSGEIGEVAQMAAQKSYVAGNRPAWMRNRASYGGTIPWIGIHMIDLMHWASGRDFSNVYSMTARFDDPGIGEMENVTASVFRLDNGGAAVLRMDYLRPRTAGSHGDDRLRVAGTRGVAEYQEATGVTVASADSKPRRLEQLPARRSLFVEFLDSVYNGAPYSMPFDEICRINEVTLAAQESADRNQPVEC